MEGGGKRGLAVWHRRAGKDDVALHWTAVSANDVGLKDSIGRVGNYWHMLPQASQARKAVWDAVNPHTGRKRIDEAFPREIRETTRDNDMQIVFKSGSTWQVVGSDNYDSLVGAPPVGIVFSEWALADPNAWAYLRPILRENGGWALFIYTPRGRNHGATFYETRKGDAEWFAEKLTVDQTSVFTSEDIAREKQDYIDDFGPDDGLARFRQEYYCDFNIAVAGSYYGSYMTAAQDEGRITTVPWSPDLEVHTSWDLGYGDTTAIWFSQLVGLEVRLIDYYETSGVGLEHYAKELDRRPYKYGTHVCPHDVEHGELGSGRTRLQILRSLGVSPVVLPRTADVEDDIACARKLLPRCWFDGSHCGRGVESLLQYRRQWDEKNRTYRPKPLHDWASNGADSFRYLARAIEMGLVGRARAKKPQVDTRWVI